MAQALNTRWRTAATLGVLAVLAVHIAMRAKGLFGPPAVRPLILGSFLLLWPTPYLFLSAEERRWIGFGRPRAARWWLVAAAAGTFNALLWFAVAWLLFGGGPDNPFVSVRDSFLSGGAPAVSPPALFLIFTGPALIFSPFGEEVFCRGVIYGRVEASGVSPGARHRAGIVTSAGIFAAIHLMHHGIAFAGGIPGFRVVSGVMWFAMMFVTSVMFSMLRSAGGSIWLAIIAHSAFNLAMNAAIFSVLV